ncbi:MAG: flagellar biosynthetic protein FliO [Pseudomonadota bacterium]
MLSILLLTAAKVQTVPATAESAVDFTWLFIKMLFILGFVSILAVLILKYGVPRTAFYKRFQQGSLFNIKARQAIEPRKLLYLVEIGKRYLVLGVTDHAINTIAELSEDEAKELKEDRSQKPEARN